MADFIFLCLFKLDLQAKFFHAVRALNDDLSKDKEFRLQRRLASIS